MCGIVGYTGRNNAQSILIDSLKRLEYRGYDSAGIAINNNKLEFYKTKGAIKNLIAEMPEITGNYGIAHTRWATHGKPSKINAHPHIDCKKKIALVHNGIIENYMELKEILIKEGHKFNSDTDTEVLVHLIEKHYVDDLVKAVRNALKKVRGSYAIAVISKNEKSIVVARNESPLIIGLGKSENFIGSDVPAVLKYTKRVIYLKDKEIALIKDNSINITNMDGKIVPLEEKTIKWDLKDAEKSGYEHFMLKEIFEQPKAIHESILGRLEELDIEQAPIDRVKIVACGTSYHAGLIGKYIIEVLAGVPVTVEMASEYRYGEITHENPLVVVITQSGETADSLAAVKEAKARGCRTIAITNVVGSSVTREADEVVYTRAGPEIGVAATKTFTTQIVALLFLAIHLSKSKNSLPEEQIEALELNLRQLPRYVQNVLDTAEQIRECAQMLIKAEHSFFIGRNINYPTALEGALKLKEISYLHAEGYSAGELKHGPLALLTKDTPVVAIAIKDHTYEKMLGNIREVFARSAPVILVAEVGDNDAGKFGDFVLRVPKTIPILSPIPISVVLQLLAYYVAKERGCSIDQPRNLAKSVTVE